MLHLTNKHTPGPWEYERDGGPHRYTIWGDERRACIGETANWILEDDTAESKANARLIAAAPELLAELQQFVNAVQAGAITTDQNETLENVMRRSCAAIAKAQGSGK